MNIDDVALRVASFDIEAGKKKKNALKKKPAKIEESDTDMTSEVSEYSCQLELAVSIDFEGNCSKQALKTKLKNEFMSSLKVSAALAARDLGLKLVDVKVKPVKIDCAANEI